MPSRQDLIVPLVTQGDPACTPSRENPMFRPLSLIVATVGLAMACGTQVAQAGSAGQYVEAGAALRTDAEVEAWYGITMQLRRQFDEICGDTFCEGDYSNLQPLRFQCAVDA